MDAGTSVVLAALLPVLVVQAVQVWQARQMRAETKVAAQELRPNGGTSARDLLDRAERKIDRLHERHDSLVERVAVIEDRVRHRP